MGNIRPTCVSLQWEQFTYRGIFLKQIFFYESVVYYSEILPVTVTCPSAVDLWPTYQAADDS